MAAASPMVVLHTGKLWELRGLTYWRELQKFYISKFYISKKETVQRHAN